MDTESKEKEAEESIQIANTKPESGDDTPELGDIIKIIGGRFNNITGRIYYRDNELIRILPENFSDRLIDIPIGDEGIEPELGIDEILIVYKRTAYSFVELFDLRVDSPVDTFDKDGKPKGKFIIKSVDTERDSAILIDEVGSENEILFDFYGIPLDAPFNVMRILDPVEKIRADLKESVEFDMGEFEEEKEVGEQFIIEAPEEVKEIPLYQRIYPDIVQKTDFLQDILSNIDPKDKRNPKNIIKIRNHIELFIRLRNEITKYRADGNDATIKPSSVGTLEEMVKLPSVPLMRPILDVKRKIYTDADPRRDDEVELPNFKELDIKIFDNDIVEAEEFDTQFFGLIGKESEQMPNFYAYLSAYMDKFNRNWTTLGVENDYVFKTDSEFFRRIVPYQDPEDLEPLSGYPDRIPDYRPDLVRYSPLTWEEVTNDLGGSMLRGLAATDRRSGFHSAPYINSERAPIINYLLFPYQRSGPFTVKRSGSLLYDIESSKQPYKTAKSVFSETKVGEEPTPTSIMLVGSSGTTLGNISIDDYFKALELSGFGITDFLPLLRSLGLSNKELTVAQQKIFTDAILKTGETVKKILAEKRESLVNNEPAPVNEVAFIEGFKTTLDDLFIAEPLLKQEYERFASALPQYENMDYAIFSYLLGKQHDLLECALGGQNLLTAQRRLRAVRQQYLNQLREAQQKVVAEKMRGAPPQPNPCHHVLALKTIRQLRDDNQRMPLLVKFIAKYQGARKDQWIDCRVCKQHLLCGHELLQVMQYSKPREKAILQKELMLNFGGGQFHGKYQCSNCGQGLGELEFDTHLEFDDDGKPMMGRSAIENKDDELADAIDNVLGGGPDPYLPAVEYKEENKILIYNVAKQIAQIVGINIEEVGFRNIVERSNANLSRLETRQDYIKNNPKTSIDYDSYINTCLVSITACAILLEIQAHIPDYVIRYTIPGCVPSFTGWPLSTIDDKSSIEYFACGLASITRNEMPWKLTLFARQRSFDKKKTIIATFMNKYMTTMIEEPTPQQLLAEKRDYYKKLYGATSLNRAADIIPSGFLPKQVVLTKVEEATEPVVPEVSIETASRVWIRESHKRAKSTALLIPGSPYTETGCCFVGIKEPNRFWLNQTDLPELRSPRREKGIRQTNIALNYKERIEEVPRADLENFLELFVHVCFRGDRIGHPHELNMLHKCDWCDFEFPKDPSLMTPDEIDATFASQEVDVSIEAYQTLLDKTRKVNSIPKMVLSELPTVKELFLDLARMDPAPCDGWTMKLDEIFQRIQRLPPDSEDIEIAATFGPLSEIIGEAEQYLRSRIGEGNIDTLEKITKMSPYVIKQSILTYVVIPLERIITKYDSAHLTVQKYYALNYLHVEDIKKMIQIHTDFLKKFEDSLSSDFIFAKVERCLNQLKGLFELEPALRESVIPGGKLGLQYFIKAMILCPLAEMIDPHKIPPTFSAEQPPVSALSSSVRGPLEIVAASLAMYRKESLVYNPVDIKVSIEARNEKELMGIVLKMDKMSKEEKQLVLMQKRLGIGAWAVGGTNAIWKYNADRYEIERDEREKAGIIDFDAGPYEAPLVHTAGEGLNAWGFGTGREAGYDTNQVAEDDY